MTIIEALGRILFYAALDDSGFEPTIKDYAEEIEKDLEILEIFKKKMKIDSNEHFGSISISIDRDIDKEDYYKIKEWLNEQ